MSFAERQLRFVRLVSPSMAAAWRADPALLKAWIEKTIPEGIDREERWIWPRHDHAEKAQRFQNTLREIEQAGLGRLRAQRFLHLTFEQADRFDAWRSNGRIDPSHDEQALQRRLSAQSGALAQAARLLAAFHAEARGVAAGPLHLATLKLSKAVQMPDGEGGTFEALYDLWMGWQRDEGDALGGPLARLLSAWAVEIEKQWTGGPAAFARGPWLFRQRVDGPRARSLPTDTTAAAFLATALARGAALDWPLHMPPDGQPHWRLAATYAAELTRADLGHDPPRRARELVQRCLSRNPGLRFAGWPT